MDKQSASCYSTHMTTDNNQAASCWYRAQRSRTQHQANSLAVQRLQRAGFTNLAITRGLPYLP